MRAKIFKQLVVLTEAETVKETNHLAMYGRTKLLGI